MPPPIFFHHFELPPRHGDVRRLQERRYRFATGLGVNGLDRIRLVEPECFPQQRGGDPPPPVPLVDSDQGNVARGGFEDAVSHVRPLCAGAQPGEVPRSPPYGLGTVLPGGHEIPELRVGGEPPYIDGRYRTGSVRDFRAEAHVRAVLYGIIEFTRRFEPELPVDRYRLCVVLQDFQQVLPDSGSRK